MRSDIWKGSISFGLLNIPVGLRTAQEDKEIHFSLLDDRDMSHIKYKRVNASTSREVPSEHIAKGYEYSKNQFVLMDETDFERANVKATQTIDIEDFVLMEEIDPMLFDKPYYVVPQKGAEKGYFVLRDALKKTEKVAVGKVVIRTKQHLALIMPKDDYLILELIRFSHQVKETDEVDYLDDVRKVSYNPKELKMATDLVNSMTDRWQPSKYKDTFYTDIMKRIEKKVEAHKGKRAFEEPEEKIPRIRPSDARDLLALLQESLATKKGRSAKKTAVHPKARRSKTPEHGHRQRLH